MSEELQKVLADLYERMKAEANPLPVEIAQGLDRDFWELYEAI